MRASQALLTVLIMTMTALGSARGEIVCNDGCNYLWNNYLDHPDGGRARGVCDGRRADAPWTLFSQGNDHGWVAGGWINGGVMANFTNNGITRNDPVPFSNPAGEFLGNQVWGFVGKQANNGGCGWAWGARLDYVFGADGPDTQAFGDSSWDFGWNSGGEYGSAIPQLYGEVAYNDLSIKIGHFYTIMGYEVVQAPGNFFYSHSYAMTFGQPFTHTGLLAEYAYDCNTTLWGGYTMGWDSGFDNLFKANTFLGGISRRINDNVNVTYTANFGDFGNGVGAAGNLGDIFSHSLVVDMQLTNRLNYVFVHDLAMNRVAGPASNAEWYGVTQYLFYRINDCWKAGFRFEWFDDADGLRISTVNNGDNDLHFFNAAVGLNWTPTANILVRPEMRFDWAASHSDNDFNDIYVNNTQPNLITFAVDFTFLF